MIKMDIDPDNGGDFIVLWSHIQADEETIRDDTSRFDSFIFHLIEHIEIVKSLKGFLPNVLPSKVMAVLLNFRPIPRYLPKKSN